MLTESTVAYKVVSTQSFFSSICECEGGNKLHALNITEVAKISLVVLVKVSGKSPNSKEAGSRTQSPALKGCHPRPTILFSIWLGQHQSDNVQRSNLQHVLSIFYI